MILFLFLYGKAERADLFAKLDVVSVSIGEKICLFQIQLSFLG